MAQPSMSARDPNPTPDEQLLTIVNTLHRLPPEQLSDVLDFVQYLEYKNISKVDSSEDAALWDAVQANEQYKAEHPDEPLERYRSGKEFLEALADL